MPGLYTNTADKVEGYRIITATPDDDRLYFATIAELRTIDTDLPEEPYRFFEGMVVCTIDNAGQYIWKETGSGELTSGGFTYASGYVSAGVDYSGRTFNFVALNSTDFTLQGDNNSYGSTVTIAGGDTLLIHGNNGLTTDTNANDQITIYLAISELPIVVPDPTADYALLYDSSGNIHARALTDGLANTLYNEDSTIPATRTVTANADLFWNMAGTFQVQASDTNDTCTFSVTNDEISLVGLNNVTGDSGRIAMYDFGEFRSWVHGFEIRPDATYGIAPELRLYDSSSTSLAGGGQSANIRAASSMSGDWTWILPAEHRPYDILPYNAFNADITLNSKGTGLVASYNIPLDFKLVAVYVDTSVAPTGTVPEFDVHASGVTIFSTKPTIDASEFTSQNAATPAVLSVTSLSQGDKLEFYIDAVDGGTTAAGLSFTLVGYQT